jgi:hypothetical protein
VEWAIRIHVEELPENVFLATSDEMPAWLRRAEQSPKPSK